MLGVQPFVYLLLTFATIRKQRKILEGQYSNIEQLSLRWAKKVLIVFALLYSISYIYDSQVYFLVFILVVNGYMGVEVIRYKDTYLKLHVRDKIIVKQVPPGMPSGCNLDMARKKQIREKILQYMSNEKPYLKPVFSLIDLSNAIGENRQYVSHVINELFQKNFHSFVNSYRINWFIDNYRKKSNYSIEGMINQCGFNSKSSFYSAFKKVTGKTPKEFY